MPLIMTAAGAGTKPGDEHPRKPHQRHERTTAGEQVLTSNQHPMSEGNQ